MPIASSADPSPLVSCECACDLPVSAVALTTEHSPQNWTSDGRARPSNAERLGPLGLAIGLNYLRSDCPDKADNTPCPDAGDSSSYDQPLYILIPDQCVCQTSCLQVHLPSPHRTQHFLRQIQRCCYRVPSSNEEVQHVGRIESLSH